MLTLHHGRPLIFCQRREFMRVGASLPALGLTLPALAADETPIRGRAKSCILLGGPPHLDTFDLKPEASSEVRGPFEPIPTKIPGTQICELLPKLAGIAEARSSNSIPTLRLCPCASV